MVDIYCITANSSIKKEISDFMVYSNKKNISSFINQLIELVNKSSEDNYVSLLCGTVSITIKKEAELGDNPEPDYDTYVETY